MTSAKDSHSELPPLTKEEARERLQAHYAEDVENHHKHVTALIERMMATQQLYIKLPEGFEAKMTDEPGEIIHLNMDPYLVKLRELHEASKALDDKLSRREQYGEELKAFRKCLADLETDP